MGKLIIDIPDNLQQALKHKAINENKTLKELVTPVLEKMVKK